jgi:hypothetical protein
MNTIEKFNILEKNLRSNPKISGKMELINFNDTPNIRISLGFDYPENHADIIYDIIDTHSLTDINISICAKGDGGEVIKTIYF